MKYIIKERNKQNYIMSFGFTTNRLRALKFKTKENATAYLNTSILPPYSDWEIIEYV